MSGIIVDVWLYGELARYGGKAARPGFANPSIELPEGACIRDLLALLQLPGEQRGISFINGELSAMPNLQPDLDHTLHDGDRVAMFDLHSMWPFQYRFGIPMASEMSSAMQSSADQGIHHAYRGEQT